MSSRSGPHGGSILVSLQTYQMEDLNQTVVRKIEIGNGKVITFKVIICRDFQFKELNNEFRWCYNSKSEHMKTVGLVYISNPDTQLD